jgi:hypothetical protein
LGRKPENPANGKGVRAGIDDVETRGNGGCDSSLKKPVFEEVD